MPFSMKSLRKLCLVACLLLFAVGCAAGRSTVRSDWTIVPGVPFFSQEAYQCGPTVLATVLDYWYRKNGVNTWLTPEQIAPGIYSPTAKGVLAIDLERFGRTQGFEALNYRGSVADLKQKVDDAIPVIIFVDRGFASLQVNHFMVVTGYMDDAIIVNSGKRENQIISNKELEKTWRKTDYWSLVLRPSPPCS
jgi:predicted double-glycine peptidase